jgi:nicotinamide mononucleotide transporter
MSNLLVLKKPEGIISIIVSLLLIVASWQQWLPMSMWEVLGFITGAASVWLAAKEHVWNWPVGILNGLCFLFLFLGDVKLYGSAGIQVLYIILGIYGWYMWLHGGVQNTELRISRLTQNGLLLAVAGTSITTAVLTWFLTQTADPAPFLDAFTTALSLTATYLLTVKIGENWLVWIAADVIFIILYASQHLYLTAFLYAIFLLMCIYGLQDWKRKLNNEQRTSDREVLATS